MESKNIFTAIHYPKPFYESEAYKHIDGSQCLKMEELKDKLLSIPIYPELNKDNLQKVVNEINNFN